MKRVNVDGLEALNEIIEKTNGKIFVLYTGSKVNGVSWCPDCVTAEPVIDKVLSSPSISDLDATFITCLIGQRDYWKNPECPFRTDPRIKINCIPTLAEWGNKVRRLLDSQLTNEHLIQDLLTSDD